MRTAVWVRIQVCLASYLLVYCPRIVFLFLSLASVKAYVCMSGGNSEVEAVVTKWCQIAGKKLCNALFVDNMIGSRADDDFTKSCEGSTYNVVATVSFLIKYQFYW